MTALADHPSSGLIKMLNIGESKSGKTGCLAALAEAGFRLHVLDYDNGMDILKNLLAKNPAAMARVEYETLRDKVYMLNGTPMVKSPPTAFRGAAEVLKGWDANSFNEDDVIVLDTLSTFTASAFQDALFRSGRLNQKPQLSDYGVMATNASLFLEMLCDPDMTCNFVVNTHIRYFQGDDETATQARGLPNAKGQEIPRTVSTMFNTVVLTHSVGTGPGTRRVISTQPQGVIEVATSNPAGVKPQYPVAGGMADLFADIMQRKGPVVRGTARPILAKATT